MHISSVVNITYIVFLGLVLKGKKKSEKKQKQIFMTHVFIYPDNNLTKHNSKKFIKLLSYKNSTQEVWIIAIYIYTMHLGLYYSKQT